VHAPGDWTPALRARGATGCTPRAPACGRCPLADACAARALGRAAELPLPRARRTQHNVALEVLVVRSRRGLLLVQRGHGGRLAGLLEPPTRERARGAPRLWPAELPPGLALVPGAELGELAHAITHHRIRATVRVADFESGRAPARLPPAARWAPPAELGALALTGLARKVVALIAAGPGRAP
jgi:A/G-specific adenine glycosylase